MPRIVLPWAFQSYSGRTRVAALDRCVNLLPEVNHTLLALNGDATRYVLVSAPGSRPFVDIADGTDVVQLYSLNNRLFAWSRKGFYEIINAGYAKLLLSRNFGRDVSVSDGVLFKDSGFRSNQLWFSDRSEVFIYDLQADETVQISDPDLRPVSSVTHLANYAIFANADSDQFQWSDIAEYSSINALSFATAEGSSDKTVRIVAFEGDLLHFGEKTLEVWRLTGNKDNPFQRLSNATLEIGCANGRSIQKLTRDIYWVSDDSRVYRTAARTYQAVPISLHQGVEHDLYRFGTKDLYSYAVTMEGHALYHLVIPQAKRTWVYDESTQAWHERSSLSAGQIQCGQDCENNGYGTHIANCAVMHDGKAYIGGKGHVYHYDLDYYRDGEELIMKEAATGPLKFSPEGTIHTKLQLAFQNSCDQVGCSLEDDNNVQLYWSNSQGKDWKEGERKPLVKDDDDYCPQWHDLGRAKSRAYKWRTFFDGQVVFAHAVFNIDGLTDGRS